MLWRGFQKPKRLAVETETLTDKFGKFSAQPFERGFGTTIGNALRRTLLSSIEGAAVTAVRIEGVLHEFQSITGVVEDATDIILNLKQIPFKLNGEGPKALYLRSDAAPGAVSEPASSAEPERPGAGSPRPSVSRTDGREEGAPGAEPAAVHGPRLALWLILALLFAGGGASAFVSDWFVNGLGPTISQLHVSQAFAGLVIVAIAGNAVENVAGIALAWKGRSDLAISIVKNSVAQIAAFLFPLLVLISFALKTTLTFSLAPVYIGALLLTTLALAQVTGDGEAAEFEGWALIALYVILGTLTLYE